MACKFLSGIAESCMTCLSVELQSAFVSIYNCIAFTTSNLVPGTLIRAGLLTRLPLLSYLYVDLRVAKFASTVSLRACLESLQRSQVML